MEMVIALEELVNSLYEMIQDARNAPFSSEKCVIEREKALDILDEIRTSMPSDLKMARGIVEKRNDVIAAGKKEADNLRKQAEDYVRRMIDEGAIVAAAQKQADDIVRNAEEQSRRIRKAMAEYCAQTMSQTEESIATARSSMDTALGGTRDTLDSTLEELHKRRELFDKL